MLDPAVACGPSDGCTPSRANIGGLDLLSPRVPEGEASAAFAVGLGTRVKCGNPWSAGVEGGGNGPCGVSGMDEGIGNSVSGKSVSGRKERRGDLRRSDPTAPVDARRLPEPVLNLDPSGLFADILANCSINGDPGPFTDSVGGDSLGVTDLIPTMMTGTIRAGGRSDDS